MSPSTVFSTAVVSFILALAQISAVAAQACQDPPAELANIGSRYPTPGQVADILPNDADALALFNEMSADPDMQDILRIAPKGSNSGDISGVHYGSDDPDCWWTWSQCLTPKHAGLEPDISTCATPSTWGLTFDDGPYCGQKPLLDFLTAQKTTATFFLIGANVIASPVEAQDIYEAGHEVCGHTWSHHYMTSLTNRQAFAEIYYTKRAIKEVVGVTSRCWRAAYGDVDDRIRSIAAYLDTRLVLWDNDTDDWQIDNGVPRATIQNNFANIIRTANPNSGTIVLDHSISDALIQMFISEFPAISAAFQHVMPALVCNNWTTPYAETNIVYPDFNSYVSGSRPTYNATTDPLLSGQKMLIGNISNPGQASASASIPVSSAAASASVAASSASSAAGSRATGAAAGLEMRWSTIVLGVGLGVLALVR